MTTPPPAERWRRIAALLDELLDLPESRRADHLDRACASDPGLKRQVLAYLAAGDGAGAFLEGSPVTRFETLSILPGDLPVTPEPEDPQAGSVGPYRLVRRIGSGGMGVVCLAERADGQFEKQVALKLVRRGLDTEEILARFRRERQILARLEHPHIARLLDGGVSDDGRPYLVMEYVEGEPITTWCDGHVATIGARLRLFHEVCETVQYAHRNLVVHRDLKPSNILVSADGSVKLLDFGIAKVLSADGTGTAPTLTRSGQTPMTPEYAAPEQALGAPLTTAADVYSLGVVLYELLSGDRPRPARTTGSEATSGLPSEPGAPPPSRTIARDATSSSEVARRRSTTPDRLRRRLQGDLDTIALEALQRDPARRYRTVEALLEDLDRHREGLPIRARRDTWRYRAGKFIARHRWGAAAAALLVLSLGAGLAGTLWQSRRATHEAAKAREVKEFTLSLFKVSDPHQSSKGLELSARDLLDAGARRVETELGGQPEIQAEMLQVLGRVYGNLGAYDQGLPLLRRALALERGAGGGDGIGTAATLHELGRQLQATGEYEEAERSLRTALALEEREVGRDDPALGPILSDLGVLLNATGHYEESEATHRRALAINRRAFGDQGLEVSMNLSDLGALVYSHARYREAADLFGQALRIREARGVEGFDTDIVRHNYAGILAAVGDLDQADRLIRRVLHDRRERLGTDHPDFAVSLDVLGVLLSDKGEYDEAAAALRETLDIRRRVLGAERPDVARTLNNLAFLEYRRGDLAAARRLYEEALAIWRKSLPETHPNILTARHGVAMVMAEAGDAAHAEPVLREILAARVERFGAGSMQAAQSQYVLGGLLARWGRHDEAETMLRQVLATREKFLGADHFVVAASRETLAGLLRDRGRLEESLTLYQQALACDRKVFPRAGPQTAGALVGLGRTLLALHRPAEAESLLREGLTIRRKAFVAGDPRTAEAMAALGCCLYENGDADEARRLLEAGIPVLERRWTPAGPLVNDGRTALASLAAPRRGV